MTAEEIISRIEAQFAGAAVAAEVGGLHPHVQVTPGRLLEVCTFLKEDAALAFDLLRCISAVDRPEEARIVLSYDLLSIRIGHSFAVKTALDRTRPEVASLSSVWPAAEWHEREAYDLMGVSFVDHPDLRRILMPDDWSGHPLRKDYEDMSSYHGLKIKP